MTNLLQNKNNLIGIIYKIQLINDNEDKTCFIDKTRNIISSMNYHRREYNKHTNTPFYNFIREKGGLNMFSCDILFESYEISLAELENKLNEFEELYKHTIISNKQSKKSPNKDAIKINQCKAFNDWKAKNKEYCQNYNKKYKLANIERLKTRITCECGGVYTRANSTTHNATDIHLKYLKRQQEEANGVSTPNDEADEDAIYG
jgi:hypothetical protein